MLAHTPGLLPLRRPTFQRFRASFQRRLSLSPTQGSHPPVWSRRKVLAKLHAPAAPQPSNSCSLWCDGSPDTTLHPTAPHGHPRREGSGARKRVAFAARVSVRCLGCTYRVSRDACGWCLQGARGSGAINNRLQPCEPGTKHHGRYGRVRCQWALHPQWVAHARILRLAGRQQTRHARQHAD